MGHEARAAEDRSGVTPGQWRELHEILDSVLPGADVRLFGSRATGRARPFSDIDLLVVEPRRLDWQQRVALSDRFEASLLPFRVDVIEAAALTGLTAERAWQESVPLPRS